MTSNVPLPIDVVSDVVCPWCYIGKRLLENAIALKPQIAVEVHFRPYFLNPWIPREGISRDDAQAAEWYQKAADQGHPQAQYHLGLMYVDGRGRARDNATGFAGFARRQTTDWQRRSMPWGWPLPQGAESRRMT